MVFQKGHKMNEGRKLSPVHKMKISMARSGHEVSQETREKIGLGRKRTFNERGYLNSIEARRKTSKTLTGRKLSFEERQKWHDVQMRILKTGEEHPNWKGKNIKFGYPRDFSRFFRRNILERDGSMCQKCNMKNEESLRLIGCKLDIHHIDYSRANNIPENCITLCRRCHHEAHQNKESWKLFYQSILKEKHNYEYKDGIPLIKVVEIIA